MNRYLISADIEGVTGVVNKSFAKENGKHYQLGCRYMTSDVNAVVTGITSADPDAWIVVRDAHAVDGSPVNLDLEKLHPKANLIQGGSVQNILEGLDHTFKGVFLVGYHASGMNNKAVLGHTLHSMIHYIKINNKFVNETGWAAFFAGHYNVPIVFISGDDHAVNEAREQINDIVGVVVKQSFSRDCAISLPLAQTKALLEKHAAEAIDKLKQNKFTVYKDSPPITFEIGFYNSGFRVSILQSLADILSFDKAYKFDYKKMSITFKADGVLEIFQRFNMLMYLVYGISASS